MLRTLVLVLVSALPGAADGPLVVRGVVRDSSGAPVAGARVTVDPPAGPSATTAADGSFSFEATGEGRLVVTAPGFAEVERPVVGHRDRAARPGAATGAKRGGDRHRGPDRDEAGRHRREGGRPRPGRHRRERRPDPRRHAAAGAGVQPVPAVGQPGRQPDLPGRVASRRGAERSQPDAGPPRRRALERRLRGLGLLEPRAACRDRAGRGPGGRGLRPLRQRGARGRRPGPQPQGTRTRWRSTPRSETRRPRSGPCSRPGRAGRGARARPARPSPPRGTSRWRTTSAGPSTSRRGPRT